MIIQRYIFKKFIITFFSAIVVFIGLYVIIKLMDQLSFFLRISDKHSFMTFANFFLFEIPYTMNYIYPLATLFSIVYVLGNLNANNEMIAIYNSGISNLTAIIPIILFIFSLSLVFYLFDDEIIYGPYQKHRLINKQLRGYKDFRERKRKDIIIFGKNNKLYFIKEYHPMSNKMLNAIVLYMDKQFDFKRLIHAKEIIYEYPSNNWLGKEVTERVWSNKYQNVYSSPDKLLHLEELPYHFERETLRTELLSTSETKKLAQKFEVIGGKVNHYFTDYYFKVSNPFISFFILFFGVPLSLYSRKSNIIIAVFMALIVAFFFMMMMFIGKSLGHNNALHPVIAGWFGCIVFTILCFILWRKMVL